MAKPSKEPKRAPKKAGKKQADKRAKPGKKRRVQPVPLGMPYVPPPPVALGASPAVLDRLWGVVMSRRDADPAVSHSARLLSRGITKVAQKFGEESVECLIEAVAGNRDALIGESADVLYHLIVVWVAMGVRPDEVWTELQRREGISGVAEKASRAQALPVAFGLKTTKIP
jgi:phosphoribosyl-ATP pyrophosphohydrolase